MKQLLLVLLVLWLSGCADTQKDAGGEVTLRDGSKGPSMVVIPGGTFWMGSPETQKGRHSNETLHEVTVARFLMGQYEVTFTEYDAFCEATKREKPTDEGRGRGNRPVINVSWHDAVAYAKWLSRVTGKHYRLPSEAEWEYAARAGTQTRFSFDDEAKLGAFAWFKENSKNQAQEVGTKLPNPWGLYDMHGNVYEWVQDCLGPYKGAPIDGSAHEVPDCALRVLRGGSWYVGPYGLPSARRGRNRPDHRGRANDVGFRLAQDF